VWCNNASANPNALGREVAALVLKFPPAVIAQAAPKATVPIAELVKWRGLYRDELTGTTLTLSANDSALQPTGNGPGAAAWIPLGDSRFRTPQGEASFRMIGGTRMITLVRPRAESATYSEVAPPPAKVPVGDYVGTYASEELDVRLVVATRATKLFLRRRPNDEFELVPTFADGFRAGGGFGSVRFTRDAQGKVTGFSIFAGRVLDVRFKRVR
jgi:hypothetical protein